MADNQKISELVDGTENLSDDDLLVIVQGGETKKIPRGSFNTLATPTEKGVMSDSDKSKLDGIEEKATADQTADEILEAIKSVDGKDSGLDADMLDGFHSDDFLKTDDTYSMYSYSSISDNYTAISNNFIYTDTSDGSVNITLPSEPVNNDRVCILDVKSSFDVNAVVVIRNGKLIMGLDEDMTIDTKNISAELIYINGDWRLT